MTSSRFYLILYSSRASQTSKQALNLSLHLSLDKEKQHKYICTNCGWSGCFPSSFQRGQNNTDQILQKNNTIDQSPFVHFWGPCPVHPMSSHTWGDSFNNPKNNTAEGQNINPRTMESHSGHRYYYSTRGQGRGYGHECSSFNVPCLTNPFPTLYIQQALINVPLDVLTTTTNTDTSSVVPIQICIVKERQKKCLCLLLW